VEFPKEMRLLEKKLLVATFSFLAVVATAFPSWSQGSSDRVVDDALEGPT
jgi:hypothetical protein